MGPPHLTLNLPGLFVFCYSIVFLACFFLFLRGGLCLLFWFLSANKNAVFVLQIWWLLLQHWFTTCFSIVCFGHCFCCFSGFLFLEVGMFSVLSSSPKKHNKLFAWFWILLFLFIFLVLSLVLICVGLSCPIKKQTQKPWNSNKPPKQKCNINLENQFFS